MHIAEGYWQDEIFIDDHGHAVSTEVYDLLKYALSRHSPDVVIFERDNYLDDHSEIVADLDKIHQTIAASYPS